MRQGAEAIIPEWVVAITCSACGGVGFECECPSSGHYMCEDDPCDECFAIIIRESEERAGWILEA